MGKRAKKNRTFKDKNCSHCGLANKKELRQGRPNYCGYIVENGKEPTMRNGHCVPMEPIKKERKKKEPATA